MPHPLRIFFSSPGDVNAERECSRRIVDGLQREWADVFDIRAILWEDLPLEATAPFQSGIDIEILGSSAVDIAVFIVWARLGTPLGPEVTRSDGSRYASGTERELDLMLGTRANCGKPTILFYRRDDDDSFTRNLVGQTPAEMAERVRQRQAVDDFVEKRFVGKDGNVGAYHTYTDPQEFARKLRLHLNALVGTMVGQPGAASSNWHGAPYRGLRPFHVGDRRIFFGRDAETVALLNRLDERALHDGVRFVCIVGPSGGGKSSLARAGVVASLVDEVLPDGSQAWLSLCLTLTPSLENPRTELLNALRDTLELGLELGVSASTSDAHALACVISALDRGASAGTSNRRRLILLLDQLEALYSGAVGLPSATSRRSAFWGLVACLAKSDRCAVVSTLRVDFFALAQADADFAALKNFAGHHDLEPLAPEALDAVVRRPAMLAGLRFERQDPGDALDAIIVAEAGRQPVDLPSLQELLHSLYELRDKDDLLTYAAYRRLGGVAGVIGRRASTVIDGLAPNVGAALAPLLRLLVAWPAGTAGAISQPAPLPPADEDPNLRLLVDALLAPDARLLVAEPGPSGMEVRLAHDALLTHWPLARQMIEVERDRYIWRDRFKQAFERWRGCQSARDRRDALLSAGAPLKEALALRAAWGQMDDLQTQFLRLSEQRALWRLWRARLLVSGGAASALAGIWLAWKNAEVEAAVRSQAVRVATATASDARRQGRLVQAWSGAADVAMAVAQSEELAKDVADAAAGVLSELWSEPPPPVPMTGHSAEVKFILPCVDTDCAWSGSADGTIRRWRLSDARQVVALSAGTAITAMHRIEPDRKLLAGNDEGSIMMLDTATARVLWQRSRPGPLATVTSLAHSVDRHWIAVSHASGSVEVLNADTGAEKASISATFDGIVGIAFSRDATQLLIAANNGEVSAWDVATQRRLGQWTVGKGELYWIAFDAPSSLLTTVGRDTLVKRWRWTGSRLVEDGSSVDALQGRFIHRSGRWLLTSTYVGGGAAETVRLHYLSNQVRTLVLHGHTSTITAATFSNDGGQLLTGAQDGTVRVWDTATGALRRSAKTHDAAVTALAFTHDGQTALVGGEAGTLDRLSLTPALDATAMESHASSISGMAFAASTSALMSFADDGVRLQATRSGHFAGPILRLRFSLPITAAALDDSGEVVASATTDGHVRVHDASGRLLAELPGHTALVNTVQISADGQQAVSASDDETVRVWDLRSAATLMVHRGHRGRVTGARFMPAGRGVLSWSDDGTAQIWHAAPQPPRVLAGHDEALSAATSDPSGRVVLTGSMDHSAALWNAHDGRLLHRLRGHEAAVNAVAISPDGRLAATASSDHRAIVWRVDDGTLLAELTGHKGPVRSVAFSPDGRQLLTVSDDLSARVWEAETGRPLRVLGGHHEGVAAAAFSQDGSTIATTSRVEWTQGSIRLWLALPGGLAEHALLAALRVPLSPSTQPSGATAALAPARLERTDIRNKTANACDLLAAHPFDPERVAPGVLFGQLDLGSALKACERHANSAVPRLRYQYGRALDAAGRSDEALAHIEMAARAGHVRAIGALAEMNWERAQAHPVGAVGAADALDRLRSAAMQGDAPSALNVARRLEGLQRDGTVGNAVDEIEAMAAIAARQGMTEGFSMLAARAEDAWLRSRDAALVEQAYYFHLLALRCATRVGDADEALQATARRTALVGLIAPARATSLWRLAQQWQLGSRWQSAMSVPTTSARR